MEQEAHRYGKLEWILYIVVLPLLFTALLSGIILQFLGVDVTGKIVSAARAVPVVNQVLPQEEQPANAPTLEQEQAKQLQELQDKTQALEKTKAQLEEDLVKKNAEIEKLNKQLEDLKKKEKEETAKQPVKDPVKERAQVYAEMSPAKAAAIISQLSVTEAKQLLSKMSSDQQAAILEKMEPAIAARMMSS